MLKNKIYFRYVSAILCLVLAFQFAIPVTPSYAQTVLGLPTPGTRVVTSPSFRPPILTGITIYPKNPLQFDFIIDTGGDDLQGEALHKESEKLIKYFMTTLTVPEKEMWVNLSPYEKNRIIANGLGRTQMGIDMLAQDYILKQLTASLMYPEEKIGSEFWTRVYDKAQSRYGTTEIPMNTFNKIWIVPEKASVYVNGNSVFIADSHLKIMLEEDYLALESNLGNTDHGVGELPEDEAFEISGVTAEIVRDILIPEIEREVNEGKNFATLRQIFHSMILAAWYKQNLKESVLGQIYVDKNKIEGVDIEDKESKQKIYEQYIKAFERGVYNYIKEDYDAVTQERIPRKYFSGGVQLVHKVTEVAGSSVVGRDGGKYVIAKGGLDPVGGGSGINRRRFLETLDSGAAGMIVNPLTLDKSTPVSQLGSSGSSPVSRRDFQRMIDSESKIVGEDSAISIDFPGGEMPYYPNAPPADYHIIVPVYNEAAILDFMLSQMKEGGYLHKITFVNDASTDGSREILDRWVKFDGIDVIHMETNQKKEGAIKKALQIKQERNGGKLPKKTILLDADTFFDLAGENTTLDDVITQVNAYMVDEQVDGISFRIDAYLPENPNVFELMHYFNYISNRPFDRFTSKDDQLRVAYGPAGMFTTDILFKILENIEPDFETGDAVITVEMMKLGKRLRYYPDLIALTRSPSNYVDFFKLHRRWERGGLKVQIKEMKFYFNVIRNFRRLSLPVLFNYMFYIGVIGGSLYNLISLNSLADNFISLGYGTFFWTVINLTLVLNERNVIKEKERLQLLKICLYGLPFMLATILPARIAGVMDAISFALRGKSRDPLKDRDSSKTNSDKSVGEAENSSNEETSSPVNPGGIDLNPVMLDLQTQGGSIEYDIPPDLQDVESIPINGFSPVIYQIIPVNLQMLMGASEVDETQHLSLAY